MKGPCGRVHRLCRIRGDRAGDGRRDLGHAPVRLGGDRRARVPPLAVFAAYVIGSATVAVRVYRSAIATGRRIGLEDDVRLTLPAVEA